MPAHPEAAVEHARDRLGLVEAVADEARRAWRQVDPARISETWITRMMQLIVVLTGAQQVAAGEADRYLDEVLDAQGIDPAAQARTAAAALAGVASDGRGLDGLLYQPVIASLELIRGGTAVEQSLASGGFVLDTIVRTQVADAGRVADQVAMTARPRAAGQIRMVVGKTCARCLVLAGRWYRWNAGFNRHPKCDCIGIPGREDTVGDLRTDPGSAFRAMSSAEQDEVFGKAGAEAIRAGADINLVVNARRGVYTADGRLFTRESAGRRPRLMPEQIFRDAKSRDDAIRLLRLHGYLR